MNGTIAEPDGASHGRSMTMRHIAAIEALAEMMQRPFDEIAAVYQHELVQLGEQAVVTDFLPVLVAKRVRRLYQQRSAVLDEHDPGRHQPTPGSRWPA
jgi:hypothetical protein